MVVEIMPFFKKKKKSAGGCHCTKKLQLLHLDQIYTQDKKTGETTLQNVQKVIYAIIDYLI